MIAIEERLGYEENYLRKWLEEERIALREKRALAREDRERETVRFQKE